MECLIEDLSSGSRHDASDDSDLGPGPDVRRMLKVYNYVNDERKAKVSIKFLALVVAFVGVAGLLVVYAIWGPYGTPDSGDAPVAQEQTDYVGLTSVEAALYGSDEARVEQLLDARLGAWATQHPDAEVLDMEAVVNQGGLTVGYDVTYRE